VVLSESQLAGTNSIAVSFTLSQLGFIPDISLGADLLSGWGGNVEGAFGVAWTASTSATPEPATMLMFGLGTIAIGAYAVVRRKRK
jgi:hypothetical protein